MIVQICNANEIWKTSWNLEGILKINIINLLIILTGDFHCIIISFFAETSHAGATVGRGSGEDTSSRQGDESGDQGSHWKSSNRKWCTYKRSGHSQRNNKGKKGVNCTNINVFVCKSETTGFNITNILWAQLRKFPCANKKFNLYFKHKKVSRELSYKKAKRKMLVKLTPAYLS